jgi:hypothetical protein
VVVSKKVDTELARDVEAMKAEDNLLIVYWSWLSKCGTGTL